MPLRKHIRRAALAPAVAAILAVSSVALTADTPKQTLGYVITTWDNALYETRFADECPDGLTIGNDELWWRGLARADRDKLTNRGLIQQVDRGAVAILRGPKGEDVCWNPTAVKDPPLNIVKGRYGYGFNLDGTTDGHATAKSCAHQKFTSPDGTTAVDNQFYRIIGCMYGFRSGGVSSGLISNEYRRSTGRGVMIMEITGVTDPRESENVEVAFYRAIDRYALDGTGEPLPYASYRIDTSGTKDRYGSKVQGKIHEGVLTTAPGEVELPSYGSAGYTEMHMRDMQMRLDLNGENGKATGLLGGYYDLETWWSGVRRGALQQTMGDWSCPATYVAGKQLADGYPDPATGECTALSTAYRFTAIPAFIAREGRMAQRP